MEDFQIRACRENQHGSSLSDILRCQGYGTRLYFLKAGAVDLLSYTVPDEQKNVLTQQVLPLSGNDSEFADDRRNFQSGELPFSRGWYDSVKDFCQTGPYRSHDRKEQTFRLVGSCVHMHI